MSIKKVPVVTPNGEHTIMTSKAKAVRTVITVRQQVMKHMSIVRQDAREQSVIKISHQISHSRTATSIEAKSNSTSYERFRSLFVRYCREAPPHRRGIGYSIFATTTDLKMIFNVSSHIPWHRRTSIAYIK